MPRPPAHLANLNQNLLSANLDRNPLLALITEPPAASNPAPTATSGQGSWRYLVVPACPVVPERAVMRPSRDDLGG